MVPVGLSVGVLGLGEAGSRIAADLAAAGATVVAYDPADVGVVGGVLRAGDPADAVRDVDLVLAVTAGADAMSALTQAIGAIPRGALYADLSTSAAPTKRELASIADRAGLLFVDVALMSTVPGKGLFTPALASGPGAQGYVG